MASGRFGRFRQWASEAIANKDKSAATEEAKEIDADIDVRREGIRRLHDTVSLFHHNLSKKKRAEALENEEKLLPREALGAVMLLHGEQLEDTSAYGAALVRFGQGHCKIATLQEAFAVTVSASYLGSLDRAAEEIREYDAEKKMLETRRVNYDAALTLAEKVEGNKKTKEKDRYEAEEGLENTKAKYDEAVEDLRARIGNIRKRESEQLRDLRDLLDAELRFAEQYAEILRDIRDGWPAQVKTQVHRPTGPLHTFSRSVDVDAANLTREKSARSLKSSAHSHKSSIHSTKSARSTSKRSAGGHSTKRSTGGHSSRHDDSETASESESEGELESDGDDDSGQRPAARSRASSIRSKASVSTSRPPSRPASRTEDRNNGKRKSIAEWASSWGRKKDRERDFATLNDGEDVPTNMATTTSSLSSLSASMLSLGKRSAGGSPALPARALSSKSFGSTDDEKGRKVVRALHDFSGSSDELTFKAGDRIIVLNEVLDGWWMGEVASTGRRGLFPTTYTEPTEASVAARPPLPPRGHSAPADNEHAQEHEHEQDAYPFGDHLRVGPYGRDIHSPMASTFSNDGDSIADSTSLLEEAALMPKRENADESDGFGPPGQPVRVAGSVGDHHPALPRRDSVPRKAPPPPPPRRAAVSSPSVPLLGTLEAAPPLQHSASDRPTLLLDSETGDCVDFVQNPFKARGMCSNCFRMHNV
ncbi:hypothetical protein K488DRAFT_87382 [Vararia minispora EC-137]|uniref:Uncharacterized protein n=1 Tax=Vararia minispora EC-137 TaxID=1314806 RepID=A0ACB8QGX8_9AGAM|nr:hypothetical protein K488DRAFT_87382 [Vararia minispora EC-137]